LGLCPEEMGVRRQELETRSLGARGGGLKALRYTQPFVY